MDAEIVSKGQLSAGDFYPEGSTVDNAEGVICSVSPFAIILPKITCGVLSGQGPTICAAMGGEVGTKKFWAATLPPLVNNATYQANLNAFTDPLNHEALLTAYRNKNDALKTGNFYSIISGWQNSENVYKMWTATGTGHMIAESFDYPTDGAAKQLGCVRCVRYVNTKK